MNRLLLFCCLIVAQYASAQYWQQRVNYNLEVSLNDSARTLDGFATITYFNNSPDTLRYIPFHLWPNAYLNDRTAFSEQLLQQGDTRFYFASQEKRGFIHRLDFKVNGLGAKLEPHPQHPDIATLLLPAPLAPQQSLVITTPFYVKLPFNFSRGGYDGNSFQLTQWYPKPAVYDRKGWHPMPYLQQGEFYSEFGAFDVRITLPAKYVVAATGKLLGETRKEPVPVLPQNKVSASQAPKRKAQKTVIRKSKNTPAPHISPTPAGTKTLHFYQDSVHDFALFANPEFIVRRDSCLLPSGRVIEVAAYFTPNQEKVWQHAVAMIKDAVRYRSLHIGEYPYGVVTAVQGPESFGGGMEYPTITAISPQNDSATLAELIGHEVGHNWFQGILASDERNFPWLDEGLNSFYDRRIRREQAISSLRKNTTNLHLFEQGLEERLIETKEVQRLSQPVNTPSEALGPLNYMLLSYTKTATWLESLESRIGRQRFDSAMRHYFQQWKFRHPYPEDFKKALEQVAGQELSSFFAQLNQTPNKPDSGRKGTRIASPLLWPSLAAYVQQPSRNLITITPALGLNLYDKVMAGALITNYKLPPSRFQFFAVPLYAFGSKQLNGIGRAGYNLYTPGRIRRTEIFVSAAKFSRDDFTPENGNKLQAGFAKLVPGLRLTFRESGATSTVRTYLQWKTFLIRENTFSFRLDTAISNGDTTIFTAAGLASGNRTLHQLRFSLNNLRELYPYSVQAQVEAGKNFFRPALTARYFFNYPAGGGLQARFFGGALLFPAGRTLQREFATDRYHLNMTGPKGTDDYTYSNYYIGRSEFEGLASQQIMMRDGGFKVRTDMLASPVGRSSKWLLAMNFSSSLPRKYNPLSVLPVKIPLRVFADIGTHAEAWKETNEGARFLFDAGLQLPLFGDLVQVYLPVVYSAPFRDYIKSNISEKRFWKTISFSIQLNQRTLNKVFREVDL